MLEEAQKLADQLRRTDCIRAYRQAEEKLAQNKRILQLVDQIKSLQKESVNLAYFQKHEAYRDNEERLARLQGELDAIPIIVQYKQLQAEINDLLQQITCVISGTLTGAVERTDQANEQGDQ
ncbi:MAG: YlbF family regulator [Sporolactobacillus sp.]